MSILKFHARSNLKEPVPNFGVITGGFPRYVGRKPVIMDGQCTWPATEEGFECEEVSSDADILKKACRRDSSIWPADEATAQACGVAFTPIKFSDGEWIASATAAKAASVKAEK